MMFIYNSSTKIKNNYVENLGYLLSGIAKASPWQILTKYDLSRKLLLGYY